MVAVNVMERTLILQILPRESDYETLKMIVGLHDKLKPTAKEITEFDYKEEVGKDGNVNISWNEKGKEAIELKLEKKETDFIADLFKKLDKNKKLNQSILGLYDKFVV